MQSWKNYDRPRWGRYRSQYVYRCPSVTCRNTIVEPGWLPASSIIDWSLPGQRIGDRSKPLAEKTMARIRAGIDRYWNAADLEADRVDPLAVPVEGRIGNDARSVGIPLRTLTTRNETGIAVPPSFIAELRGGSSDARSTSDPLATVTAGGTHHGLVTTYYGNGGTAPAEQPLSTITTVERHALLMRNNGSKGAGAEMTTPASEVARTITTHGHQSLLQRQAAGPVDVDDVLFRMLTTRELIGAMAFPGDYVVLGNRREQARMAGNAVTPPAARDLVSAVVNSLGIAS